MADYPLPNPNRKTWRERRDEALKPEYTCSSVQNMLNLDVTIPEDVTTGSGLWDYVKELLKEEKNMRIKELCDVCRRCSNCQCGYQECYAQDADFDLTKTKLSMFVNFTN